MVHINGSLRLSDETAYQHFGGRLLGGEIWAVIASLPMSCYVTQLRGPLPHLFEMERSKRSESLV